MTISELADAVGMTRRAIHFYIQRGLLPCSGQRGRSAAYGDEHLVRLRRIIQLQGAGHSLESIRRILDSNVASFEAPASVAEHSPQYSSAADVGVDAVRIPDAGARVRTQLVVRLRLAEGVELLLDARRDLDASRLPALRSAVLAALEAASAEQ